MKPVTTRRRGKAGVVPARNRDHFRPGLKPRGHEDVLYPSAAELLATLPQPRGRPIDDSIFADPDDLCVADDDPQYIHDLQRRQVQVSLGEGD